MQEWGESVNVKSKKSNMHQGWEWQIKELSFQKHLFLSSLPDKLTDLIHLN